MPDSKKPEDGDRPEFEVAYYTKELGPSLQRKMARQQMAQFTESTPAEPDESAAPSDPGEPSTPA